MEIKKLVIDRAKWGTGMLLQGEHPTQKGKMCCLGFLGLACGLKPATIEDQMMPDDLSKRSFSKYPAAFRSREKVGKDISGSPSTLTELAADINDANPLILTNKQKEGRLKRLFAKNNIKLTFTGRK